MNQLYTEFDFNRLNSSDFKEDSVREVLILPLLKALGYSDEQIIRSKKLKHPFIKIGSKKRPINLVPDYLLQVQNNYAWVLDAKAPTELICANDHVEQVYSYAIHPEVRAKFFALCNGHEFCLFKQDQDDPLLRFDLRDISAHWENLKIHLSPSSFQSNININITKLKDSEICENYAEEWAKLADLDRWRNWTERLLVLYELHVEKYNANKKLVEWIISRVWPKEYTQLEDAFRNFSLILYDLQSVFSGMRRNQEKPQDIISPEKPWHVYYRSQKNRERAEEEYDKNIALVIDLTFELTRAANHICEMVRLHLLKSYRIKEGDVFLSMEGQYYPDVYYSELEKQNTPIYPGLEQFKEIRFTRSLNSSQFS